MPVAAAAPGDLQQRGVAEAECDRPRQLGPASAPITEDVHREDGAPGDLAPGAAAHQGPEVVVARHAEALPVPGLGGHRELHPDPGPGVPGGHHVILLEPDVPPLLHDNHRDIGQADLGFSSRLES